MMKLRTFVQEREVSDIDREANLREPALALGIMASTSHNRASVVRDDNGSSNPVVNDAGPEDLVPASHVFCHTR